MQTNPQKTSDMFAFTNEIFSENLFCVRLKFDAILAQTGASIRKWPKYNKSGDNIQVLKLYHMQDKTS